MKREDPSEVERGEMRVEKGEVVSEPRTGARSGPKTDSKEV